MADGALPAEVASLNATLLRSFRTAFASIDRADEGAIPTAELPLALRSLSLNPTERELRALSDELVRGASRVSFVLFCQIAARLHATVRTPGAMARLFAQFDPGSTGVVTQATLREIFSQLSPTPLVAPAVLDGLIAYAGAWAAAGARAGGQRSWKPLPLLFSARLPHVLFAGSPPAKSSLLPLPRRPDRNGNGKVCRFLREII
jgi:Ca2+-binding EF-hand superfamily protein